MHFVNPPYLAVVEQAFAFAKQHGQRVDAPHLVWAIIEAKQWPGPVPPEAQVFLKMALATAHEDSPKPRDTTLYAQMVLDRSHDVPGLLLHLFWSPWAHDQPFIQTWHHRGWAPPFQAPHDERAPGHEMPPEVSDSQDARALRLQRRETVQKRRGERPVRIIEILLHGRTDGYDFWCTHAIQYPSHCVVSGLQWREGASLSSAPQVVRMEIETPARGAQVWPRTRFEALEDGQSQRIEYQFIAEGTLTLTTADTLFMVIDGGQRVRLSTGSQGT